MRSTKNNQRRMAVLSLAFYASVYLFACGLAPSSSVTTTTPIATVAASTQPGPHLSQTSTPQPAVYQITQDHSGETVTMHANELIQLSLGDGYLWSLHFGDEHILSILDQPAGDEQDALYIIAAEQTGQTELQAVGEPKCRQVRPPCGMPSVLFTLRIIVE